MNKAIWAIIVIIIIVLGGWLLFSSMNNPAAPASTTNTTATNTTATTNTVYQSGNSTTKGTYMTDIAGKTLYTFDNDNATPGASSCTGTCAANWPPYTVAPNADTSSLPSNVTVITRPDGSSQYAYNGKPLYYYAKDTAAGQLNGDGVGGVWHIVQL